MDVVFIPTKLVARHAVARHAVARSAHRTLRETAKIKPDLRFTVTGPPRTEVKVEGGGLVGDRFFQFLLFMTRRVFPAVFPADKITFRFSPATSRRSDNGWGPAIALTGGGRCRERWPQNQAVPSPPDSQRDNSQYVSLKPE